MDNRVEEKINTKIKNNEDGLPKDIRIQDPSLNVESPEERPGIGIEILGVPGRS